MREQTKMREREKERKGASEREREREMEKARGQKDGQLWEGLVSGVYQWIPFAARRDAWESTHRRN